MARLEKSKYRENFILKGAFLLLAYKIPTVRPSKDIDFLGKHTPNEIEAVKVAISEIAEIDLKDGVQFYSKEINIEQITEDAEYNGIRIRISAKVGGDKHRLQLDIGFGDIIVDGPVDMFYPTILEFPSPNIKVYSIESAMAEKLEAIVSLGAFGSRMKDYFDVWFLILNHNIDRDRLKKAIETTFNKRKTPVDDFKYIFSDEFKTDVNRQRQWNAFLNRSSLELNHTFKQVINDLETFYKSIL